ncbi:MAG TPA: response regulator transcription factor [Paracoccus sp. (in: a-proteobacteria)]|jgi:two-component system OmpR family response regulator|nr:response regulator transcription factor [Paracoccus sp. (in: a-proteobacteria)]
MRVLLVEDHAETAQYITTSLRAQGHMVDHCDNGREGFLSALDNNYDVMVFDRMLPGLDGLTLTRSVRGAGVETPILILSAMDGIDDRVDGLEAGSDDYLVKPFSFQELSARLSALTRRPPLKTEDTILQIADLEMNLIRRTVTRAGVPLGLQPREFSLLEYLMRNAGRVLTRTMLLEAVWDFHFDPKTNVVETHISRLRNKVDKPFDSELIHTVRGAGYSLHG